MESESNMTQANTTEVQLQVDRANCLVVHFEAMLKCITQWFQYLPCQCVEQLVYKFSYFDGESEVYHHLDELTVEMKRGIAYSTKRRSEVDISGYFHIEVSAIAKAEPIKLSFGGKWMLYHTTGIVWFGEVHTGPSLQLYINGPVTVEQMIPVYELFHSSINQNIKRGC